jgi:nicotinamide mononucleotide adenylyltransferase
MAKHGFFMGRMNPIHLGHEAVIDHMIKTCGEANCTLILGSANAPTSMRQFFSYTERRGLIRKLYPTLRLVGMPDYPTNDEWLVALHDTIESIAGTSKPREIMFFTGDDDYYVTKLWRNAGYQVTVLNRFDGTTPVVSATEVRDCLLHDKPLDGLLNPKVIPDVERLFRQRWEEFKKV